MMRTASIQDHEKATMVQASYRGFACRKRLREKKEKARKRFNFGANLVRQQVGVNEELRRRDALQEKTLTPTLTLILTLTLRRRDALHKAKCEINALRMQALYRGNIGRDIAQERYDGVVFIQSRWRGRKGRERRNELRKKRDFAADTAAMAKRLEEMEVDRFEKSFFRHDSNP